MNELCPHGRTSGAYCEPCAEKEYPPPCYGPLPEGVMQEGGLGDVLYKEIQNAWDGLGLDESVEPTGLDAPYYKTPFGDVQDMLEWLEEGGAPWNVLNVFKSIWREFNPVAKKETTALYEAEKRYYYAERDLRNVRKKGASRERPLPDAKERLENKTKE